MMQQNTLIAERAVVATMPARAAGKAKRHYDPGATSEWYTPGKYIEAARRSARYRR